MGGAIGAITAIAQGGINSVAIQEETQGKLGELYAEEKDEQANAEASDRSAVDAIERGRFAAGVQRWKGSKLVGEQRVAAANSGVDTQSGTPANLMADTRLMSELDAKQIQNNATREAWGHREEAGAARRRKQQYENQEKTVETQGTLKTVGNFIGTTGSAYSQGTSGGGGGGLF